MGLLLKTQKDSLETTPNSTNIFGVHFWLYFMYEPPKQTNKESSFKWKQDNIKYKMKGYTILEGYYGIRNF